MARFILKLSVEVDADGVPGWGNKPEDFIRHIENLLEGSIPHYKPTVVAEKAFITSNHLIGVEFGKLSDEEPTYESSIRELTLNNQ